MPNAHQKTVFLVKGISGRQAIFGNIVEVFNQGPTATADEPGFDSFEITGVFETKRITPNGRCISRLTIHFEYQDDKAVKLNGTMWVEQMEVIE